MRGPHAAAGGRHGGSVGDGRVENEQARIAVGQNRTEVLGLEVRVERRRDAARRDRAPERDREERPVGKDQGDAVAGLEPLGEQSAGEAPHGQIQLRVGRLPLVAEDRHAAAAPFRRMAPDEPGGRVEPLGQVIRGAHRRENECYPPRGCRSVR